MEECGWLCGVLKSVPEVNAWLLASFTFLSLVLRASADFLAWIGAKIDDKSTSDFGVKLAQWAMFAAKVVGWFGSGVPKRVLEEKIKLAK